MGGAEKIRSVSRPCTSRGERGRAVSRMAEGGTRGTWAGGNLGDSARVQAPVFHRLKAAARLSKSPDNRCAGFFSRSRPSGFGAGPTEAPEILRTKRMRRRVLLEEEATLLQPAVRPVGAHRTLQGQARRTDQTASARTVCGSHATEARAACEGGDPLQPTATAGRLRLMVGR
jgi:hypothetical protein